MRSTSIVILGLLVTAASACAQVLGDFTKGSAAASTGTGGKDSGTGGSGGTTTTSTAGSSSSTGTGGSIASASSSSATTGSSSSSSSGGTCAAGQTCVPPTPVGWTQVTFDPASSAAACPAGYDAPTIVEQVTLPSNDVCACSCGAPSKNPCTQGTGNLGVAQQNGCNNLTTVPITIDGSCDNVPLNPGPSYKSGEMIPLPPSPVSCSSTATLPPIMEASGRTCKPSALGEACSGGTCLTTPPSGQQCIQASGNVTCPSPYEIKYTVYAPTSVTDDRTCATCTCLSAATTCENAMLAVYPEPGCAGPTTTLIADGACQTINLNGILSPSCMYTATPNTMTCSPTSSTVGVMGQVKLPTPTTICCE